MKSLILILLLSTVVFAYTTKPVYADIMDYFNGDQSQNQKDLQQETSNWQNSLKMMDTKLKEASTTNIKNAFNNASKVLLRWMVIFGVIWLIFFGLKTALRGQGGFYEGIQKIALLIILGTVLQYKVFVDLIQTPLEIIFVNLPLLFNSYLLGNANTNTIFDTLSNATLINISKILGVALDNFSLLNPNTYIALVLSVLGALALFIFYLLAYLTMILTYLRFYLVLGMAPLWIICFFWGFTRTWGLGAIKEIATCVLTMILLVAFMSLYADILNEFGNQSGVLTIFYGFIFIIIAVVGIYLITLVPQLVQSITGGAIDGSSKAINTMRSAGSKGAMSVASKLITKV